MHTLFWDLSGGLDVFLELSWYVLMVQQLSRNSTYFHVFVGFETILFALFLLEDSAEATLIIHAIVSYTRAIVSYCLPACQLPAL